MGTEREKRRVGTHDAVRHPSTSGYEPGVESRISEVEEDVADRI